MSLSTPIVGFGPTAQGNTGSEPKRFTAVDSVPGVIRQYFLQTITVLFSCQKVKTPVVILEKILFFESDADWEWVRTYVTIP